MENRTPFVKLLSLQQGEVRTENITGHLSATVHEHFFDRLFSNNG